MKNQMKYATLICIISIAGHSCSQVYENKTQATISENNTEQSVSLEEALVRATIDDYIEGTANGIPSRLERAFHEDMNLYTIDSDTLKVLSGETYRGYYKEGDKRNRIGKIISIDVTKDAAIAKLEVDYPDRRTLYTDYILLLKVEGQWKMIHKSYTSITY